MGRFLYDTTRKYVDDAPNMDRHSGGSSLRYKY
jgi:hypothetical protein